MLIFEGRCEDENTIVGKFQSNNLKSTHLKYIFKEKYFFRFNEYIGRPIILISRIIPHGGILIRTMLRAISLKGCWMTYFGIW